jgi:predicted metalloprotease with PDZ domain
VRGLPQGLPGRGDEGLDRTHTWGRTYWGGALFWLLADVGIRERTGNRFGLEHALRAVVAQGGSIAERWPLRRALEVGDRAVGTKVLEELYAKMSSAPANVDLDALFGRLGVAVRGKTVEFDDDAPLARVRRAISERR